MKERRPLLIALGMLVITGLLALLLRDIVYEIFIVPSAFITWQFGLLYRSLAQSIWWWLVVVIVLFMLAFSLVPEPRARRRADPKPKARRGQVEDLAMWLKNTRSGVYFKWMVANRLGKLAYQLLLHRESGRSRSVFTPLAGTDWEPSKDLQTYLETGLRGSFADYPSSNRPFASSQQTPLDYEVEEAVKFLELQVKNNRSGL